MLKKIDFTFNNPNNNADILIELLLCMRQCTGLEKVTVGTIDAVPNDQKIFYEEKGMFSEEVFNFNNQVRDEHGLIIHLDELLKVLKQCRTVWEISVAITLSESKFIPSLEDTEKKVDSSVLIELNLIEGDLCSIFYKDDINSDNLFKVLEKYEIAIL